MLKQNVRYFAYGSNLDPVDLRRTCANATMLTPAILAGYRRDFTRYSPARGGGVADVVPDPNAQVHGGVYEIPDDELAALDRREGAYRRIEVDLQTPTGLITAMTYTVKAPIPPVPPTREYLDHILAGIKAWSLPREEADTVIQRARDLGLVLPNETG